MSKWNEIKSRIGGSIQEIDGVVHVLNETRDGSWCGEHEMDYRKTRDTSGESFTCPSCIERVIEKWYPIIQKKESIRGKDLSKYLDQDVDFHKGDNCPKCQSENIGRRFENRYSQRYEQTVIYDNSSGQEMTDPDDDYSVHHDTYCCYECNYWDFYDAFQGGYKTDDPVDCPVCEKEVELVCQSFDWFDGSLDMNCKECQTRFIFKGTEWGFCLKDIKI